MRERSAAQSLFAGPWRPKQEGDEKTTRAWFSTPRAPSSGRAIPHLMPSLIQEAASRGGGGRESIWRASDDRRWHQEDGFAPITDSHKNEPRLGRSREAAITVPAPGLLARQGGRDQAGKPAQCGRQTGRPTSTSNTTSSTRRSRAHRERRRSRFGRGGMACTATTRRRPRLRVDRKVGRALAQPMKTSSATCWRRASRSRMAFPVDIACTGDARGLDSKRGGRPVGAV